MRANIVGAGAWGTAFAHVLLERGHEVTLACRDAEQAQAISEKVTAQPDPTGTVGGP